MGLQIRGPIHFRMQMKSKKISEKEKKLRTFLREEQARQRKLQKEIENNPDKWKFGSEGGGKKTLESNKRIEDAKNKLKKFGYKGKKEKTIKSDAGEIVFAENLGSAWDKKDAMKAIFEVILPERINGYWLDTQMNLVLRAINKIYSNLTSKDRVYLIMDGQNFAEIGVGEIPAKRTTING